MRKPMFMGALALSAMALTIAIGDEALKSGPQVGKSIPGAFHPTNVTGAQAGKKHCLV